MTTNHARPDSRPPQVAVGAIVVIDDHVLLIKRGRPPGRGLWSVPGGRVEADESLEEAVVRELFEETGVQGTCGPLVGWAHRRGRGYNVVILDFAVTVSAGTSLPDLRPGDDADEAQWVDAGGIDALPLVTGLAEFLGRHNVLAGYSSSSDSSTDETSS